MGKNLTKPVKKEQARTRKAKKAMLAYLRDELASITIACDKTGISRETHYFWFKTDKDYAKAVVEVAERELDFAESELKKLIKDGNPQVIMFYLKTKGRKRGYVERQETELSGGIDYTFRVVRSHARKKNDDLGADRETGAGARPA